MNGRRSMLLTELASGIFVVQGYPSGETVYVRPEDAGPLRAALAAASGELPGLDSAYQQMATPPVVRPRIGLPELDETRPLQAVTPWA